MTDPITPLDPQQTAVQEAQTAKEWYVHRVLVAGDIFLNVLRGGPQDVTISTSAGLAAKHGEWFGRILSSFLNLFQADHGAKAAAGDAERAQAAEQLINQANVINQQEKP